MNYNIGHFHFWFAHILPADGQENNKHHPESGRFYKQWYMQKKGLKKKPGVKLNFSWQMI